MRRLVGFSLFWIAVGIVIGLFIESIVLSILLILALLLIGYNLFLCG